MYIVFSEKAPCTAFSFNYPIKKFYTTFEMRNFFATGLHRRDRLSDFKKGNAKKYLEIIDRNGFVLDSE